MWRNRSKKLIGIAVPQPRNDSEVVEYDRLRNHCFGNRVAGYTDGFDMQSE